MFYLQVTNLLCSALNRLLQLIQPRNEHRKYHLSFMRAKLVYGPIGLHPIYIAVTICIFFMFLFLYTKYQTKDINVILCFRVNS